MIYQLKETFLEIEKEFKEDFNLLIFYTDWCGPWQEYSKILSEISSVYPEIAFYLVNVEENESLRKQFNVHKAPICFFYKKTELFSIKSGLIPKTELLNMIQVLRN